MKAAWFNESPALAVEGLGLAEIQFSRMSVAFPKISVGDQAAAVEFFPFLHQPSSGHIPLARK
jgi:hypothetical protein